MQLFAWRIGQAQALAGARVPSTNTDGLYTMDIDEATNNKILQDVAKTMHINIEPEIVDVFVSKDSNNRLEFVNGNISEAKGGTLTSWAGPTPTNNLDHPAMVDRILARYLVEYPDAPNREFNENFAKEIFLDIWREMYYNKKELLRYLQIILASSDTTHRYIYATDQEGNSYSLQRYNRAFLVKPGPDTIYLNLATKRKMSESTWKNRVKNNEKRFQHDPVALKILEDNGFTPIESVEERQEAKSDKIKGTKENQNFIIVNQDLGYISDKKYYELLSKIDAESYIDMVKSTFEQNWQN